MAFRETRASLALHLPPFYIGRIMSGVHMRLNDLLMRFVDELGGVMLAYWDVALHEGTGRIINETPWLHFHVHFRALVFAPAVGSQLEGVVNQVGYDHVGLLSFGIFNASIPAQNLPDGFRLTSLEIGQVLRFTVQDIHRTTGGLISLVGALAADAAPTAAASASATSTVSTAAAAASATPGRKSREKAAVVDDATSETPSRRKRTRMAGEGGV